MLAQRGESKKIGRLLNGEDIPRKDEERPDFLRYVSPESKHNRGVVVGIEHFLVDHVSEPRRKSKEQRLQSCTRPFQKGIRAMYDDFHEIVNDQNVIPDEVPERICQLLQSHLSVAEQSTFPLFMQSFQQGLSDHSGKAGDYRQTIRDEAQKRKCDSKLIFLIEVRTDFSNLFLHADGNTNLVNDKSFVLFDQVITLLEKVDKRVDYVVLCGGDPLFTQVKTIAFSTKNIRAELQRRHIKSYFYCGHDALLPPGQSFVKDFQIKIRHDLDSEKFTLTPEANYKAMDPEFEKKYLLTAAYGACILAKRRIPIALNVEVEIFLEISGRFIRGWKKSNKDNWSYEPILLPQLQFINVNRACDAFRDKWGLHDTI